MTQSTVFADEGADGGQYKLPSEKKSTRVKITPELMRVIKKIESGGNPRAVTKSGTYKGLYQLSDSEFSRLGGRGDIFNPQENERIAALKLQHEADRVAAKLGRTLTPGEIYLVHQQGEGGAYAHITNPDRAAWQSMRSTLEGREKGERWSRDAIWGNVPDKAKARYGSVENLTSGEFAKMWSDHIARNGGGSGEGGYVEPSLDPTPNVGSGEGDYRQRVRISKPGSEPPAPPNPTPDLDPSTAAAVAAITGQPPKDYGGIMGDTLANISQSYANGPIAQNAARASGPTTIPAPALPTPPGVQPVVDPKRAEMQRQMLALAMQRLNSGKLV